MIARLSHATIYVLDQDRAYDFYVNKLGFRVHTDARMGPGMRWLTVTPPEQPDLEIILMAIGESPHMKADQAAKLRELVAAGTFGFGVFHCRDIQATYEEMRARGVVFHKPPTKEFYGTEALFRDDSGNWFSLGQSEPEAT